MPTRATLFRSNGLQTIRLPEAAAFPETVRDVMIVTDGPRRIITPAEAAWDDFFDAPGTAIGDRDQPNALERS
jgi:antitoxin VapB